MADNFRIDKHYVALQMQKLELRKKRKAALRTSKNARVGDKEAIANAAAALDARKAAITEQQMRMVVQFDD